MAQKRAHKTLTIAEKHEILQQLSCGVSGKVLAQKYAIGTSTISDIKRNSENIIRFIEDGFTSPECKHTLRKAVYPKMESELYKWFVKQREKESSMTYDVLSKKAIQLYAKHYGDNKFKASKGWVIKFNKRHNIRQLKVNRETPISDSKALESYIGETDFTPLSLVKIKYESVTEENEEIAESSDMAQNFSNDYENNRLIKSEIEDEDHVPLQREEGDSKEKIIINPKVKHDEAIRSFRTCILWAEENGVESNTLSILQELHQRAIQADCKELQHAELADYR